MKHFFLYASALLLTITLLTNCKQSGNTSKPGAKQSTKADSAKGETEDTLSVVKSSYPPLDKKLYDSLLKFNAHGEGHIHSAICRLIFFPRFQRFTVVANTSAALDRKSVV